MKIALMYDFDKTLSYKDMQEYGFFNDLGYDDAKTFWQGVDERSHLQKMDHILTYLYEMVHQCKARNLPLTKSRLAGYGKQIEFYPGVTSWFELMNEEADQRGIQLEHYIISSGLKEIIDQTPISKYFKKIYACEYLYDENDEAVWPKLSVNYTMKTQFIFRINKGILEIDNDEDLNKHQDEATKPISFRNMIYIGDGFTDVPSMKLVKSNGGHAIAVSAPGHKDSEVTQSLLKDHRVDFVAEADYTEGKRLHVLICSIFDTLVAQKNLEALKDESY